MTIGWGVVMSGVIWFMLALIFLLVLRMLIPGLMMM